MPSWGGMINGLLTLRGAWDKVRIDPVLKFMVVAITGYGMATEGPTLSLKVSMQLLILQIGLSLMSTLAPWHGMDFDFWYDILVGAKII